MSGDSEQDGNAEFRRLHHHAWCWRSVYDPDSCTHSCESCPELWVLYPYDPSKRREPINVRGFHAKGGRAGGRARALALTPERRREIARNAVAARHKKKLETRFTGFDDIEA